MAVRTRVVSFGQDRTPNLRKIRLGFETDHLVERLEFVLPEIAESQTATLMMNGKYANAVLLGEGGEGRCFVDLTAEMTFTYDEFKDKITRIEGITLGDDKDRWIGQIEKNPGGYVLGIYIGSGEVAAADVRSALELRSCCFDVERGEEKITITTYGYGHLVGMSQYGADYMARQGSDYKEILAHYYPGTIIK